LPTFRSERWFQWCNGFFILAVSILMLMPLVHLLAVSLSAGEFVSRNQVYFWPKGWNISVYEYLGGQSRLWRSLGVSVYITLMGTMITLLISTTLSYALSRKYMPLRSLILKLIVVTFIFSLPLIPFFLVVRDLGLLNSLWSLMIPTATGAYYIFIMAAFFRGLSSELFEAGRIDGCNEYRLFWQIAVPMSIPVIATIALFHAVYQWNSYFYAIIFIRDHSLYPMQMLVREMVILDQMMNNLTGYDTSTKAMATDQLKAGVVLFVTFPILLVYPFIQKYFVKGAMLGSLKE